MIKCHACNGSAVVWQPMMMSTADIPEEIINEQIKRHIRDSAATCPVCEGRGMVPDGFYDFSVVTKGG